MAILVDQARWPWRDTYWCHLVSDTDLGELHEFARQLGCRRVGFQGDHYDIDVVSRQQAIDLGAIECDSRELVRRLKAAGLRLRPSQFEKWSLVARGDRPEVPPMDLVPEGAGEWVDLADGFFALKRRGGTARALVLFGASDTAAAADLPSEDVSAGRFVRVDRDGGWAIELISPPPSTLE